VSHSSYRSFVRSDLGRGDFVFGESSVDCFVPSRLRFRFTNVLSLDRSLASEDPDKMGRFRY
jgi:hypothetical protein